MTAAFNTAEPHNYEEIHEQVSKRLLPCVYVLVAPTGRSNVSRYIANAICAAKAEGSKPTKFTIIDSRTLFSRGSHSPDLEEKLTQAAFTAETPDQLPASLWIDLFKEAFTNSPNPMGNFLITNFPTDCCMTGSPMIHDQFDMLEGICAFAGILHVKLSEDTFTDLCSDKADEVDAYLQFSEAVKESTLVQFGSTMICEPKLEGKDADSMPQMAKKVLAEFTAFREKKG